MKHYKTAVPKLYSVKYLIMLSNKNILLKIIKLFLFDQYPLVVIAFKFFNLRFW